MRVEVQRDHPDSGVLVYFRRNPRVVDGRLRWDHRPIAPAARPTTLWPPWLLVSPTLTPTSSIFTTFASFAQPETIVYLRRCKAGGSRAKLPF